MSGKKKWTREAIIATLRDCDEPPTARDLQVPGNTSMPAYRTVWRTFGSLEEALKQAGYEGVGQRGRRKKVVSEHGH